VSALSRRSFFKTAGALVLGVHLPARAQAGRGEVNAWVMVLSNELVIIRYARSEMGQGSMTAAAQLVAEELDCDWKNVRVDYADSNEQLRRKRVWGPMSSSGSRTIRESHEVLRNAGAAARELLVAAAAQGWGVAAAECRAANGVITHAASGRRTTYGRVAAAAAKLEAPKQLALKPQADWKLAGKSLARLWTFPTSSTGRTRYGVDTQLPNMVYAAIAQCPVPGGRVRSVDEAPVRGRRGVLRVSRWASSSPSSRTTGGARRRRCWRWKIDWEGGANASFSSAAFSASSHRLSNRHRGERDQERRRGGQSAGVRPARDGSRVRTALPRPRHARAAELHRRW
jgi:isoquinoline 1-oxidoreductase beta subunit